MAKLIPDLEPLIALTHHRWAIPILAELHRDHGAKFVTLVHRLGISKDALSRTLEALIDAGWVSRNPGYGHPLRPEYILTTAGKAIGPHALKLMTLLHELEASDTALKKWTLPVLKAVHHGIERFSSLKTTMPNLSPRALTLTIKDLEQLGWLERAENTYRLNVNGQRVADALGPLESALETHPASTRSA